MAAATDAVASSCGADIKKFCGAVTRGQGRVLLCMQAHEDQLSLRCQFALYRASRKLGNAIHRVERIADACWNDIQAKCGDAERIGQCVVDKRDTLSRPCQRVVATLQTAAGQLANLRGMRVFSSDNRDIGQVVDVKRGPDGQVQSIQIEAGRFLGLGTKTIEVNADTIEQLADRIRLRLGAEQVRSLSDRQKP
ncbi:MAG TPA: PRC-barrel domain-containing protein [Hyphomicrobiaceae bacterium]|nr:PRC-barrel domain-containing protein [Hyphomicrobiaceae bacterium]